MPSNAKIIVPAEFRAWRSGFGSLGSTVEMHAREPWEEATQHLFDRSQEFVHVITGALKRSGKVRMSSTHGEVAGEVEYDAPHAGFEHDRGGEHAYLDRAWEATEWEYGEALGDVWERVVTSWR